MYLMMGHRLLVFHPTHSKVILTLGSGINKVLLTNSRGMQEEMLSLLRVQVQEQEIKK